MGEVVAELKNIRKVFPGVVALDGVSLTLRAGEIHGLIGENGAGKSTLIKILTGVYMPDGGEIYLDNQKTKLDNPLDAKRKGISCVYQELEIAKDLSITDNMFLGNYKKKNPVLLDYKYMNSKAKEIMKRLNQDVDPTIECGKFGMGVQQMVEIGKSILTNAKILILDEPTSSLGETEALQLFKTIRELKEQGMAIVFISHKLEEIFDLCDVVTVIRDGKQISTNDTKAITKDQLIADMVGRSIKDFYPKAPSNPTDEALRVENICSVGVYKDVSFSARKGEILGFAGLVGAGRTEVFRGIFGADPIDSGKVFINGKEILNITPREAIKDKLAFLTEDRKAQGLVLQEPISKNIALPIIDKLKKAIFVDDKMIDEITSKAVKDLRIKVASNNTLAGDLSGGNQQKVVIGKWLNTEADIYIFDEPTRGIDVGAKIEVYNIMNELVAQNKCVIMISSELPEILGMSDRVIIMRTGKIMADIPRESKYFNQEDIMKAAWGGKLEI